MGILCTIGYHWIKIATDFVLKTATDLLLKRSPDLVRAGLASASAIGCHWLFSLCGGFKKLNVGPGCCKFFKLHQAAATFLTLFKLMQLFSSFFNLLQLFQTFSSCCSWDWIKKNSYALLCGNIHKCEISLIWLQETKAFEMKSNDVSRSKFNQMIQLVLVGWIHRYFMHFCSYCKPAQRNTWPTL